MRLTKLSLRGVTRFTSPEPITIDVDAIGPGLVALVGPNGAGKSTLLEAAVAALYRSFPSRPGWYENFTGRDAFLEATFWDLERAEEITVRTQVDAEKRTTEQYVFVNGKSVTTGRAKEAEAELETRFGSLSLLLASVFASQGKQGNFLLLPKRDRKALMVELLGLSYLEALHESAKEHRVFADRELAGARARMDALAQELEQLPELEKRKAAAFAEVDALENAIEGLRAQEAEAVSALERARLAAQKVEGLREALESATREVRAAERELRDADALPALIEARTHRELETLAATDPEAMERRARERHAKALAELDARKRELEETVDRGAGLGAAQEELTALEAEAKELNAAEVQASRLELEKRHALEAVGAAERAHAEAEERWRAERSRLERQSRLLAEVPCTEVDVWRPGDLATASRRLAATCPLLADARGAAAELGALTAPSEDEIRRAGERQAQARAAFEGATVLCDGFRLEEVESRIAELRETLGLRPLVDRAAAELAGLEDKYGAAELALEQDLEEVETARERIAAGRARVEEAKAGALEEADAKLRLARAQLEEAREREDAALEALGEVEAVDVVAAERRHLEILGERTLVDAKLRKADQEHAAIAAQLEQLREKERSLKPLRGAVSIAEEAVGDWGLLAQALGRDGIQALEIDASGPEVARITNELLEACYGPRFSVAFETLREKKRARGEYSEVFDVRVYDRGVERVVEALSGGERVVVGEAIGLALSIFNARKSGVRWRTLFRDETAGALDPVNAHAYVDMLRRALALGGFEQVLFVSHSQLVWERADVRIALEGGRVGVDGAPVAPAGAELPA